jgi:hypothetical protein
VSRALSAGEKDCREIEAVGKAYEKRVKELTELRSTAVKKEHILAVLFFGGLWGISEAVVGDALYRANVPYASVPLTAIGFVVMTTARAYYPQKGTATLIAACAMLYKFLNVPFFACHLLGILLTGMCYDLFFGALKIKSRWLSAAAATYLSYALFALMMTYVVHYEHWVQGGFAKVLRHVGMSGSMAALACAVLVPATSRLGEQIRTALRTPSSLKLGVVPSSVLVVTAGLWIFGIAVYIF